MTFADWSLAHRNLHTQAGVLHRDISVLNILLGDNHDSVEGFLIDLDMAIFHEHPPCEISAQKRTVSILTMYCTLIASTDVFHFRVLEIISLLRFFEVTALMKANQYRHTTISTTLNLFSTFFAKSCLPGCPTGSK